jgi:probable addiction module antidote protein
MESVKYVKRGVKKRHRLGSTIRIKVADLPDFDAAPYLDSEDAVAPYLTDILEANDPALLAAALGAIARARGMSEIAKAPGLTREALYKALRADAQPCPRGVGRAAGGAARA